MIPLAHALVAVEPDPVGQTVIVRGHETALPGGHVLRAVQAERRVPPGARLPAAERGAVGLAGVLDDGQTVAVRDGRDRVHVGHQAEQVDRHDRSGPWGDRGLDPGGIDKVGVWLDVDEDRGRARVQDGADRRVERVADRDDLVARAETQAGEDAHLGDRPVRDRDRVLHTTVLGPALLQIRDALAHDDHAAGEDLGDRGCFRGADVWTGGWDHAGAP